MDSFWLATARVFHSGKQSYFHIALIFHDIFVWDERYFSNLTAIKAKNKERLTAVE